ncbi:MFS transporter [Pseudooceanicola algae]|uniref:MFS transporter n=1 Tax=Pseudooceanicola algae TaxID=1537215 RepID=UPI001E2E2700|nr:MFS transporter [Pseudooceanicola algae]
MPEFRSEFSMSAASAGLVSSLGFAGFFAGLLVAQLLLNRRGPEHPVLAGLAAATLGLGLVAIAPNVPILAAGVFLAATSAGFAWTPFNDAVHRKVRDRDRASALSVISTGTSVGIALAGVVALGMVFFGFGWRICWGVFAAASIVALAINWAALRQVEKAPDDPPEAVWRDLLQPVALPLFGVAFIFGITSAIYISFAADRFAEDGLPGLPQGTAPALVFIFYGLFGLTGLATDRLRDRIGLTWLVRLLMLAGAGSLAAAAFMPDHLGGLATSAGLQGIHVMMTSAVLAFWSESLFPAFPSLSFTAALLAVAAGCVIGPALAGLAVGSLGPQVMFYAAAVLPLVAMVFIRARFMVERQSDTTGSIEVGA